MPENLFERVKSRLDLRQIVRLEGQNSHGDYISGICPFHPDNEPSLLVYKDGWRCMAESCPHPYGSVLDWIARMERGITNPTGGDIRDVALELDGDKFAVNALHIHEPEKRKRRLGKRRYRLPKKESLGSMVRDLHANLKPRAWDYLIKERGFTEEFIGFYMFGWTGTAVSIPVWEGVPGASDVLTIRYRNVAGTGPRYFGTMGINMPMLFNAFVVDWLRYLTPWNGPLYVMFGETDAALATQEAIPTVSPTNGCRAFDPAWVAGLGRVVTFVPDKGEEDAAYKAARDVGLMGEVQHLRDDIPGLHGKDFTEMYMQGRIPTLAQFQRAPIWDHTCSGYVPNEN